MQQEHERPLALLGDVEAGAVGGDEPVLPGLDEQGRGVGVMQVVPRRYRWGRSVAGLDRRDRLLGVAMVRSGLPLIWLTVFLPTSARTPATTNRSAAMMRNDSPLGSPAATRA